MSTDPVFGLRIDWIDRVDGKPATTFAAISVHFDGNVFWPTTADSPDGAPLEWYADHLLSHLTKYWKRLVLEQRYPIQIHPLNPSNIWERARARWSSKPEDVILEEEDKLMAFDKVHNLAHAFGGMFGLHCLWVVREYNNIVVDNGEHAIRLPYEVVVDALGRAGDEIAARLMKADEGKWAAIVQRWKERNKGDSLKMLKLSTNILESTLEVLVSRKLLSANDNVVEVAKETEIKVAARMVGDLPPDAIADVIQAIMHCEHVSSPKLNDWSGSIMSRLEATKTDLYFQQGIVAASALREILGIEENAKVDPFGILELAGITLHEVPLHYNIDALACWGPIHGPAVIINPAAKRLKNANAHAALRNIAQARITAAHELCHLLLDRDHMVTTVEVLKGYTPVAIEQRARAFAPALLLPKSQALKVWDEEGQPTERVGLERVLKSLSRKFGVTAIVASWKLEHGIVGDPKSSLVISVLDELLPSRSLAFH